MTGALSSIRPSLAPRDGEPPLTTRPGGGLVFPHQQVTQLAPIELQDHLVARVSTLAFLRIGDSCVSVPGARAFSLHETHANGPGEAFQCGTEFAHVHPPGDGSLHMTLPPAVYEAVLDARWGEPHPVSGTMLVFGPRDRPELDTVWQLVLCSYRFALGEDQP